MRRFLGAAAGYACVLLVALLTAEFVSSSSPIPLLVPLNLLAYGPYWLLLLGVSARHGPLSFRTHYLFGALIGLGTESFVTKVVWGHPESWQPVLPMLGGFGSYELFFLVLVYHPVFSCAVPFLLCRHYLGLPQPVRLADRPRRLMLAGLPVVAGLLLALGQSPGMVAVAFAVNAVVLTLVVAAFRALGRPPSFRLPRWLLVALVAVAVAVDAVNLPRRFVPGPVTLGVTIVLIALVVLLVVRSVRVDGRESRAVTPHLPGFTWRGYLGYLGYFAVALAVSYAPVLVLGDVWRVVAIALACLGGVVGNAYLVVTIVRLFRYSLQPSERGARA